MEKTKKNKKDSLLAVTECSIMIALSTVLSIVKLFEMPYGGSITLASMLPIAIIAYRHGIKHGVISAAATSLIQMLLGVKNFSYFTTWQSLVALALLDYVVAFTVFGLCGVLRPAIKKQSTSLTVSVAIASILRYACHVISGATVWAGLSIPTEAALIYSLSYNATYMIPETVILVLCTVYVASALDFRAQSLTRLREGAVDRRRAYCLTFAGAVMLAALIADVVMIFAKLQNGESGEFDITALADVNWIAVAIVTGAAALVCGALVIPAKRRGGDEVA